VPQDNTITFSLICSTLKATVACDSLRIVTSDVIEQLATCGSHRLSVLVIVTRFSFGFSFGFSFEFSFGTDILLGDFPGQLPANTQSIFLEFGLRREQVEKVPCASPRPCPGFRVQRVRAETKTTGGIFLRRRGSERGEVLAVGPG